MQSGLATAAVNEIWESGNNLANFYAFLIQNPQLSFWQKAQIFSVRPDVKICKSFDDWHDEDDRRIARGSKGIPYFDENEPNRRKYVFDISQTYGWSEFETPTHPLTVEQLYGAVNRQNVMKTTANDGTDKVRIAVDEYCREHFGFMNAEEYDEEYLACLSEGITECLYRATGNEREAEVGTLPFDYDTNVRICQEVETIAKGLMTAIIEEERRMENDKRERQRVREIRRQSADNRRNRENETAETKQFVQSSLWDFTAELFNGAVSERVLEAVDDGQTRKRNETHTDRSGSVQTRSAVESRQQSFDFGLLDESAVIAGVGENDGRIDTVANRISPARNYRLTEKNFEYETGAKTRYKNNIAAIKLLFDLEANNRAATDEEKAVLARYVGWGGLAMAFDSRNDGWATEYAELKGLLSDKDYRLASESVLSAHYTDKTIIDGVYGVLAKMGLKSGRILEPSMGVGNFIGLLPNTFKASESYGVELDSITGRIAKQLYPETHIEVKGFEETNFANNSFDAVVTNVPFGAFKVYDRDYDKLGFYIHNYFIAKALDKVRAGGIVAVITSKGTMDKQGEDVRQYIADRAKLLGAIRLPNNAFKTSAGTEVTSDILFFQKREHIVENAKDDWVHIGGMEDGIPLNRYFLDNPQMLLGVMAMEKSMYGGEDETTLKSDGRDLKEAMSAAIAALPENVYDSKKAVQTGKKVAAAVLPADEKVKNYCYKMVDGTLYQRIGNEMVAQSLAKTNVERMEKMIELRTQIRHILELQIEACSDEVLEREQRRLNLIYDNFVAKYGIVNSRHNRGLFRDDADFALLISIEDVDEASGTATKTDIFSKRTIQPYKEVTSCDNVSDALNISKSARGIVDIRYIEQLTGKDYDTVIRELGNQIYQEPKSVYEEENPYSGWETASEYLSGNVKAKLAAAEIAADENPKYARNVEALKEVQPAPLDASQITARLGSTWIDTNIYRQFIVELLDVNRWWNDSIIVDYEEHTGSYTVKRNINAVGTAATSVYGTERMDAFKIFEHCLNLKSPKIYDTVTDVDGKEKRVLNQPETVAAREKQKKIQDAFKEWIFDKPERREHLVNKYNGIFNHTVVQTYDGSYLEFPEMSPLITLKDYQKDAVDRMLTSGNTLLHHVVGAGKTFEIAAAAMKMRQLGIAKKPMIVVPNHLVVQWANEFRTLYPNANLLIATKKDFEKTNRMRFVAKVATGDWDAVIIAASSFEKIPISKERQEAKIADEIASIEFCIEEAKESSAERFTIKNLEKVLKNKQAVLKKLTDDAKKDNLLKFEDLGVDALFVDEAHKYKNKFIFTKMNNVAGISTAMSQRASDLDMKCEYINEMRGSNTGVVFATGTPISNSMVEMFTMQSYLQREELRRMGMQYFDGWAANFGETITGLELAPSGQGYRTRTRFAKFTNMSELLKMYYSIADVKTADKLNLPTPKAERITVMAKPSDEILELNEEIVKRAKAISDGQVKPWEDNMLSVTHDGKMIALDPRCYNPNLPDSSENKVNLCVDKVFGVWEKTAENRSTQIIFCDMSTPKVAYENYNPEVNFDIYNDIKRKLVEMGIPPEEIAFIHEAKTDNQKQTLFDKVRKGDVRILLGSTEKCGAGTNIQNKLIALHHLDTPYRPSDLEQREGRIVRQGNTNAEVQIYTYVTERTFDAYSYQILENKQRFISQINNGDLSVREVEDIDETTFSYAEIKAMTAANPKIKRKMEIEQELSRLNTLEWQHRQNRYRMQDKIRNTPSFIQTEQTLLANAEQDIELRDTNKPTNFSAQIGNTVYTERKDAGEKLLSFIQSQQYVGKSVGKICGFDIVPCAKRSLLESDSVDLVGNGRYNVTVSESSVGTITRLENALAALADKPAAHREKIAVYESEIEVAKREVDKPFEYAEQIFEMREELETINAELDLGKQEAPIVLENEDDTPVQPVTLNEAEDEDELIAV